MMDNELIYMFFYSLRWARRQKWRKILKKLRKWSEKRKSIKETNRWIKDLYSDTRCPFKRAVGFSAREDIRWNARWIHYRTMLDTLMTSMILQAPNLFSLETLNLNNQLFVLMEEHLPHHQVSSQMKCYDMSFWLE